MFYVAGIQYPANGKVLKVSDSTYGNLLVCPTDGAIIQHMKQRNLLVDAALRRRMKMP